MNNFKPRLRFSSLIMIMIIFGLVAGERFGSAMGRRPEDIGKIECISASVGPRGAQESFFGEPRATQAEARESALDACQRMSNYACKSVSCHIVK